MMAIETNLNRFTDGIRIGQKAAISFPSSFLRALDRDSSRSVTTTDQE